MNKITRNCVFLAVCTVVGLLIDGLITSVKAAGLAVVMLAYWTAGEE